MVNHQFKIVQLGNALPDVLMRDYEDLIGLEVDKVFKFTKPVLAGKIHETSQLAIRTIHYTNCDFCV